MRRLQIALLATAVLWGCSSNEIGRGGRGGGGGGGGGGTPKDAGTNGGMNADAGDPDAGPFDSGVMGFPDAAGPMGNCNPVDGTGCNMGNTCVYQPSLNEPQCRMLASMQAAPNAECDVMLQNCGVGYSCINLTGGPGPRCLKICRNGNNTDCASVPDTTGNGFACLLNLNGVYGACAPRPTSCVPYNDTCMMGEHCEIVGTELGCVPDGMAALGQPCGGANGACMRGGICVNLTGTAVCMEPCDPNSMANSCSGMNQECGGELSINGMGLGFGVCQASAASCSPLTVEMDCMMGENCDLVGRVTQCVPEGTALVGQPCGGANGFCQRGGVCINLQGSMGPQCYQVCDPMSMMSTCTTGMCQGLQGIMGFGICG